MRLPRVFLPQEGIRVLQRTQQAMDLISSDGLPAYVKSLQVGLA